MLLNVGFSYRTRPKKRLIFPGKTLAKRKTKKKDLSKLEADPNDEKPAQKSGSREHHDGPDDNEGERTIRKSTRTSVIVRQAERDAIRAALQATMKVSCLSYYSISCWTYFWLGLMNCLLFKWNDGHDEYEVHFNFEEIKGCLQRLKLILSPVASHIDKMN